MLKLDPLTIGLAVPIVVFGLSTFWYHVLVASSTSEYTSPSELRGALMSSGLLISYLGALQLYFAFPLRGIENELTCRAAGALVFVTGLHSYFAGRKSVEEMRKFYARGH